MSTRAQIGFYSDVVEDGDATVKPDVMLYVHSDGYPKGPHGVAARLGRIIPQLWGLRPWWETDFMAAQVLGALVIEFRQGKIEHAKQMIAYDRKELRKLKRKWGKSSPAMFAKCNEEAIRKGNFSGNKLGRDIAYHLESIEDNRVRAQAPVTEIISHWDAQGFCIIGSRQLEDYAYYYAVMPGMIRVYEASSPQDDLLTSEREARLLFKGKRPSRWSDATWERHNDRYRELNKAGKRDMWYKEQENRVQARERRSPKLYAALQPEAKAQG